MARNLRLLFSESMSHMSLCPHTAKIAVAYSGGADSTALLMLCRQWIGPNSVAEGRLTALHIDHMLRRESQRESEQNAAFARSMGIPFISARCSWPGGKPSASRVQKEARKQRYLIFGSLLETFEEKSREVRRSSVRKVGPETPRNVPILLTAHHRGDDVETMLMRLGRSSGIDGLGGIRHCSRFSSGHPPFHVGRPLLRVSKRELVEHCEQNGWEYIRDPSNFDHTFDRVRTRAACDELEIDEESLSKLTCRFAAARDICDVESSAAFDSYTWRHGAQVHIAADVLQLPRPIVLRALGDVIKRVGARAYKPRLHRLRELYKSMKSFYEQPQVETWHRNLIANCKVDVEQSALSASPIRSGFAFVVSRSSATAN